MLNHLNLRANIAIGLILAFLLNSFGPLPYAQADEFLLPKPGIMVALSPAFNPPILKGIKVHPDNPFRFEFILDQGDETSSSKVETSKLIKYFLASLTIPENDLWVNLSPYEKDRIIPNSFGLTEMGRDLLAEDYMLKQITASLIYPEGETGKKFWKHIYEEAQKRFGTTNIPVNTFNKVWIVPEKAVVYENAQAGTAYVVESKLKVMLEEDYLSLEKHTAISPLFYKEGIKGSSNDVSALGSQIVREIVIPELTREVNGGKNFTQLRQVYNSLILATWYKKKIKDSILEQVYADKSKVAGVQYTSTVIPAKAGPLTGHSQELGIQNKNDVELIYQRYIQAFKKGVYNYIKEDTDPLTQQPVPRKYFSGGVGMTALQLNAAMSTTDVVPQDSSPAQIVSVNLNVFNSAQSSDQAMHAGNFKPDPAVEKRRLKLLQIFKKQEDRIDSEQLWKLLRKEKGYQKETRMNVVNDLRRDKRFEGHTKLIILRNLDLTQVRREKVFEILEQLKKEGKKVDPKQLLELVRQDPRFINHKYSQIRGDIYNVDRIENHVSLSKKKLPSRKLHTLSLAAKSVTDKPKETLVKPAQYIPTVEKLVASWESFSDFGVLLDKLKENGDTNGIIRELLKKAHISIPKMIPLVDGKKWEIPQLTKDILFNKLTKTCSPVEMIDAKYYLGLIISIKADGPAKTKNPAMASNTPVAASQAMTAQREKEWENELGINKEVLANAIVKFPQLAAYDPTRVREEWERELGIGPKALANAIVQHPPLVGLSPARVRDEWESKLGISRENLVKAIEQFPTLASYSVANNLKFKKDLLDHLKVKEPEMVNGLIDFAPMNVSLLQLIYKAGQENIVEMDKDLLIKVYRAVNKKVVKLTGQSAVYWVKQNGDKKDLIESVIKEALRKGSKARNAPGASQAMVVDHQYTRVTGTELDGVYSKIVAQISKRGNDYVMELIRQINKNPSKVKLPFEDASNWQNAFLVPPTHVFQEGLFKDENGIYWILKKKAEGEYPDGFKNLKKRELFAYLLMRGIANYVPIRPLSQVEAAHLQIPSELTDDYYLTRVVVSGNMDGVLTQQEKAKALSAIFTARIFLRNRDQHLGNIVTDENNVPVAIDNDGANLFNVYPATQTGYGVFISDFILEIFKLIINYLSVQPNNNINYLGVIQRDVDLMMKMRDVGAKYGNIRLNLLKGIVHDLGIGNAFVGSEGLEIESIRQTISNIKAIKNVPALAEEAGYSGQELEDVVAYVKQNQKTLGADADLLWEILTGQKGGFKDLDNAMNVLDGQGHPMGAEFTITLPANMAMTVEKNRGQKLKVWANENRGKKINMTLEQLGGEFGGLTRERVRQILTNGKYAIKTSRNRKSGDMDRLRTWANRNKGKNVNKSQIRIADKFGVSKSTAGRILQEYDITTRGRRESEEVAKLRVWAKRHKGNSIDKTQLEIADDFNVSGSSADRILQEYKITTKGIEESEEAKRLRIWAQNNKGISIDKPQSQIADEYDLSGSAVGRILQEYHIKTRGRKESEEAGKFRVWAINNKGSSIDKPQSQIADEYKVSESVAGRILNEYGIKTKGALKDEAMPAKDGAMITYAYGHGQDIQMAKTKYPSREAVIKELKRREDAGLKNTASALRSKGKDKDITLYKAALRFGVELPKEDLPEVKYPYPKTVRVEFKRRDAAGERNTASALLKPKSQGGDTKLYYRAKHFRIPMQKEIMGRPKLADGAMKVPIPVKGINESRVRKGFKRNRSSIDSIEFISHRAFMERLKLVADALNSYMEKRGGSYAILLDNEPHSSKRWVYELIAPMLKYKPVVVAYDTKEGQAKIKKMPVIVILDDMLVQGRRLRESLSSLDGLDYQGKVIIGAPYASSDAFLNFENVQDGKKLIDYLGDWQLSAHNFDTSFLKGPDGKFVAANIGEKFPVFDHAIHKGVSDYGITPSYAKKGTVYYKQEIIDYKRSYLSPAMAASNNTGGIDLNAINKEMQVQSAGEGIKFHLDAAQMVQLQNATGFVPVIINIQPMTDLRAFLLNK